MPLYVLHYLESSWAELFIYIISSICLHYIQHMVATMRDSCPLKKLCWPWRQAWEILWASSWAYSLHPLEWQCSSHFRLKIYLSSLIGIKKKISAPETASDSVMLTSARLHGEDQTVLQNPGIVLVARQQRSQKPTVASIHYDFEATVVLPGFQAQKSWATLQHNVRLMARSWDLKKKKNQFWILLFFPLMFKPLVVSISKLLSENMNTRNFALNGSWE